MTQWRSPTRIAAALLIAGGVAIAIPAFSQHAGSGDTSDLQARIEHLERDVRDLQQEVFRNGGGARDEGPPPAGIAPSSQRLNDLEASLQRLTGQLEELTHRVNDLSAKVDQMQNDMNYHFGNQGGAQGAGEMAPAPEGAPPQQLAPGPSNLGTVPQGAVNNVPAPKPSPVQQQGANAPSGSHVVLTPPGKGNASGPVTATGASGEASTKYNAAMDQLARGAYDQARAGFRAVADQFPTDRLAQEALYWAGDISYSAKKDYAEAARSFAEMLKKYPKAPHAPEGMLKLGESLLGLNQKQEGCATLAAFPAKYPTASKTLLAKARTDAKKARCK